MSRSWLLFGLNVGLDLLGIFFGIFMAVQLCHLDASNVLGIQGLLFAFGFLSLAWSLGSYSFLRWPCLAYRQVLQRWLVVVFTAFVVAWIVNPAPTAVLFHRSSLSVFGISLAFWGSFMRFCLYPLAKHQASRSLKNSSVFRSQISSDINQFSTTASVQRKLLLLFVAYHPSRLEVEKLQACLSELSSEVGYAVVVNDYNPGESVDLLFEKADCILCNHDNPGYGRAVNRLFVELGQIAVPYIGVLNTDLTWDAGTFEELLAWMNLHPRVSLAVPQILDQSGQQQKLCKQNPTLLGLFSRRFIPNSLKPSWLKRYDRWYVMAEQNYDDVFEVPYLSGCCMLIRSEDFRRTGGFDEQYFLYLEDADITRNLAREGQCVHLPVGNVVHGWGRGNYRDFRLAAVNLISAWKYFCKWGWSLW